MNVSQWSFICIGHILAKMSARFLSFFKSKI